MLLICRYAVAPEAVEDFLDRVRTAVRLLGAQPGCRGGELARAVDETEGAGESRWTLLVRFDSVPAFRRALSPFEIRTHVVPLLAESESGSGAHEILLEGPDDEGSLREHVSLIAEDHADVRLGEAAAPHVRHR